MTPSGAEARGPSRTLLDVAGLHVGFERDGRHVAIADDVDLSVEAGRMIGIVGETGAGKTLVTRAVCGLLPAGIHARGRVRLGDAPELDLQRAPGLRHQLGRRVSIVLQNPFGMLDPLFRVRAQLVEGVVRHGLMTKSDALTAAERMLRRLAFDDAEAVMALYPHELSGGMAQRVAIAMALMPSPQLLFVDEPTSALDAHVRLEVLELLRSAGREIGAAAVLISHDLSLVGRFCDRVSVLYAGHVVEEGPTADVLAAPAHPYTEALVRAAVSPASAPRRRLPVIGGAPPQPGAWPAGCVFEPRCAKATEEARRARPAVRVHGTRTARCLQAFESAAEAAGGEAAAAADAGEEAR